MNIYIIPDDVPILPIQNAVLNIIFRKSESHLVIRIEKS